MSHALSAAAAAIADILSRHVTASGPIGLAVSGGGDSMALLSAAAELAGHHDFRVVTIDHGLRAEAREEAALVAERAAQLAMPHQVVAIDDLEAGPGLQARAREARYAALSGWSHDHGLAATLLGHTRDDVAETFLMRIGRGAGTEGLAAPQERILRGDAVFLRPFLDLSRAELRDFLRAEGQEWAEDPSNDDASFARVRMRRLLDLLDAEGLARNDFAAAARHLRETRAAMREASAELAERIVTFQGGDAVVDPTGLNAVARDRQRMLLTLLIGWIGRGEYAPRGHEQDRLLDWVTVDGPDRVTLGGCVLDRRAGALRLSREAARMPERGDPEAIYDGRWLFGGEISTGCHIAPVGEAGLAVLEGWRQGGQPRHAAIAAPALWQRDTLIAAPSLSPRTGVTLRIVADFPSFCLTH